MKKILYLVLTVILSLSVISAYAQEITSFNASASGGKAMLEWNSGRETGVLEFRVQRSLDGFSFYDITAINPMGDFHSYRYEDNDLFKGVISTYYYRIKVVLRGDRYVYSRIVEVAFISSNVNRTWGSIKALFK